MKQEHKLAVCLDSYEVADADPALLDRIVATASVTPQQTKPTLWRQPVRAYAASLAAIAFLGFLAGAVSSSKSASSFPSQKNLVSDKAYLNEIIFGPQTWKEVSL